jgi:uncharacterized membrane protein YfcA
VTLANAAFVGGAAFIATVINAGAGGGSFISFPALLAVGISPISANATNNTAMWIGSLTSAGSLGSELRIERRILIRLLVTSILGSVAGAVILLRTTNATFAALIPALLFFSTLLFIVGPTLTRKVRASGINLSVESRVGIVAQFAIAVYGGFFGAAAGILILALLGLLGLTDLRQANALKVLLAAVINGVAVVPFVIARAIAWDAAAVACVCAVAGGYVGAGLVKRLPSIAIRRFVIFVGCSMTLYFAWRTYGVPHA